MDDTELQEKLHCLELSVNNRIHCSELRVNNRVDKLTDKVKSLKKQIHNLEKTLERNQGVTTDKVEEDKHEECFPEHCSLKCWLTDCLLAISKELRDIRTEVNFVRDDVSLMKYERK